MQQNIGSNMVLRPGDIFYPTGNVILTPVFEPLKHYTVSFESGGADGMPPSPITQLEDQTITLPGPGGLVYQDAFFDGWKSTRTEEFYYQGDTLTISENITLSAQWVWMEAGERF